MIQHLKLLDRKVKVALTYIHFSQKERYQIYILMSVENIQQQMAELLGRLKSTISLEIARNTGGSRLSTSTSLFVGSGTVFGIS